MKPTEYQMWVNQPLTKELYALLLQSKQNAIDKMCAGGCKDQFEYGDATGRCDVINYIVNKEWLEPEDIETK